MVLLLASCGPTVAQAGGSRSGANPDAVIHFTEAVANIEYADEQLTPVAPRIVVSRPPDPASNLWFGRLRRRLPDDPPTFTQHDVPFAVQYAGDNPVAMWCDLNLNGKLSDERPVRLYHYPSSPGARAAVVDLSWRAAWRGTVIPVSWKLRVVLEPIAPPDSLPRYHTQRVFSKIGEIPLDGTTHRGFLFDGNNDGIYTMEYRDGLFVDLDDDGRVVVDPTSAAFLPFAVAAQLGKTLAETVSIDPSGSELRLRMQPGEPERRQAAVGEPAPEFYFESLDGKLVRLSDYRGRPVIVYFWAAWCGACEELATTLRGAYDRLHPRGLEVLGISFDEDRTRLLSFEEKHREPWPISFLGRGFWENRIARLYGVSATGSAYLVDPGGKLVGLYYDFEDLEEKAVSLLLAPEGGEDRATGAR
jgi:peroxiredoxin